MTRFSSYLLPTLKQPPADAEALSHKLMVRAGLVRQIGAGLWSYLPAGWRVQRKIESIIREEMDSTGAQEVLLPVIQPVELWKQTGRDGISELFHLQDRKGAPLVLAMTHEEAMTYHVARETRSYRDLPFTLYQFQLKSRDEPRPRAGVLRTREFIMKDAYSFDRDEAGLAVAYDTQAEAYKRIFDRCGLEWYMVDSDVGMMGGSEAHEFMAPCPAGENEVALAAGGYAANVDVASAVARPARPGERHDTPVEVPTPGRSSIEDVASAMSVHPSAMLKSLALVEDQSNDPLLVVLRGDHRLNEIKLQNVTGKSYRPAHSEEITSLFGSSGGYIGPVGSIVPVIADSTLEGAGGGFVTGANRPDTHIKGVEIGRDFTPKFADVRTVETGDIAPGGAEIEIVSAIEIGNIFKLGTRYSEALGATFLDESGGERPIVMGSYGIGPARIAAATVEQRADDAGISWPRAISPFEVHLVALGKDPEAPDRKLADDLYDELRRDHVDVIYDDRDAGTGAKFADAELLGCPLRVTIGKRSIESDEIELQIRHGRQSKSIPLVAGVAGIKAELEALS